MTFLKITAILCFLLIFLYGLFVAHFYHSLHDLPSWIGQN
jgi:hypothetical protein